MNVTNQNQSLVKRELHYYFIRLTIFKTKRATIPYSFLIVVNLIHIVHTLNFNFKVKFSVYNRMQEIDSAFKDNASKDNHFPFTLNNLRTRNQI